MYDKRTGERCARTREDLPVAAQTINGLCVLLRLLRANRRGWRSGGLHSESGGQKEINKHVYKSRACFLLFFVH